MCSSVRQVKECMHANAESEQFIYWVIQEVLCYAPLSRTE